MSGFLARLVLRAQGDAVAPPLSDMPDQPADDPEADAMDATPPASGEAPAPRPRSARTADKPPPAGVLPPPRATAPPPSSRPPPPASPASPAASEAAAFPQEVRTIDDQRAELPPPPSIRSSSPAAVPADAVVQPPPQPGRRDPLQQLVDRVATANAVIDDVTAATLPAAPPGAAPHVSIGRIDIVVAPPLPPPGPPVSAPRLSRSEGFARYGRVRRGLDR